MIVGRGPGESPGRGCRAVRDAEYPTFSQCNGTERMPLMDRILASNEGTGSGRGDLTRRPATEDFALPSRGDALVTLRPALEGHVGPVLVTGEPGVGKSWLWRRL